MSASAHAPQNPPATGPSTGSGSRPAAVPRRRRATAAVHPAEGQRSPEAAQPAEPRGARFRRPAARRDRDSHARVRADGRGSDAGQHGRARDDPQRHPRRGLRPRAARAAAARPEHQRHPGQHLQAGVHRARPASCRRSPPRSRTIATCCASSTASCRPSAAAWTTARPWSMRAWPTARVSTPSSRRSRWMARCSRSAVSRRNG